MAANGPDTLFIEMSTEAADYKRWIISKMRASRYTMLFDILYNTEFTWVLSWDEHRASDGKDLRIRYEDECGISCRDDWLDWPCSFLEMLVALAYSIEDKIMFNPDLGDRTYQWFWVILGNLGLDICTDDWLKRQGRRGIDYIDSVISVVLNRSYDTDGHGGMFPLRNPEEDQRSVELWYQANAYFLETIDF